MWMLGLAILVGAVVLAAAMRSSVDDAAVDAVHGEAPSAANLTATSRTA
jgi:hypothetical protein